ncbi:MAG: hypothetical protein GTO41_04865, partial [Burkholderiales bacterium]|nr:hypothetical protein [Burkholderiales bacterium]
MSTAPLYELGAELQELIDRIIDADGEIDQETEMLLDRVQLQFDEKVEKCVLAIRAYKARAEM